MSLRDKYTDEEWEELQNKIRESKPMVVPRAVYEDLRNIALSEQDRQLISTVKSLLEKLERTKFHKMPTFNTEFNKLKKILENERYREQP